MKCARTQDLFSSYLEGTMETPLCVAFEQHLAECPSCKSAYDRFHAAVMMLDEMPEVEPPLDLHASVMARVQRSRVVAPKPVRWWQIDWQHVFTIRVPARAAALGVAMVLFMAMIVQLTPLGGMVANIFGVQRNAPIVQSRDDGSVPGWKPYGATSAVDSGLSIRVAQHGMRAYDLQIGTKSAHPVAFSINAGSQAFSGVVAKDQQTVITVSVPHGADSTTAELDWRYKDQMRSKEVFLPARFDEKSSGKKLTFAVENARVRDVLRKISESYGVVVLASGDLDQKLVYAGVDNGNPKDALYSCLRDAGIDGRALDDSVYAVEPTR